ncbi:MAG: type II secretion system protein M [Candidatus Competibacteraceae bacterium]
MKNWWNNLGERERWIVGGGGTVTLLFLLYTLAWHPFQTNLRNLRQTVAAQHQDLAWMQQAAREVKRLSSPSAAGTARQTNPQSLLTLVDQTARAAGLGPLMKRIEPQGEDKLRVQFEQVSFDQLVRWLGSLEQDYGVTSASVTLDRQAEAGRVDARLVLQGKTL